MISLRHVQIMKRGNLESFDPPTRGHLDVMRRASLIVDELHVMIGVNPRRAAASFRSPRA